MPITITIPERELFDERTGRFIDVKSVKLVLEHSLLSISKWEAKWHKPFFSDKEKTKEEMIDYVRCMTISGNCDSISYYGLTRENFHEITEYIENPMTATTITKQNQKKNHEIITNELIYYWMTELNIPFSCEKWHINHLMTLIEVASIKKQPSKKMSKGAIMRQNHSLNAARRAQHHTRG